MKKIIIISLLLNIVFISCSRDPNKKIIDITTNSLKTTINDKGAFVNFIDVKNGKDYISKDTIVSVMSIRIDNQILHPIFASLNRNEIILNFENDVVAHIKVEEKETHFTLELISITNKDIVELIVWGPYPNIINKIISETVGVVRGDEFALGIQALNIKTLGGYPWNESDRMPAFDIFRENDPNNMKPNSDGSVLYRVEAAKPTASGSSLQAYCRNRDKERFFEDFNHKKIVAPIYNDGGVIGSKIAIFGCPVEKTLETIGQIEITEGLPHPMINGKWAKTAPNASASYLITPFTEDNVDQAIELTKKAGLKYLYHYGKTFENWGQFDLYKGEFPNGIEGLKKCVEKAEAAGIKLGTHVLSNFITTNDPYVTPIPDKRLAKVGSSIITNDIDATQTEILIKSPEFFNQMKNNNLKTVVINNELIRYGSVSKEAPWRLLNCQRGAFETEALTHKSGEKISKLLDHSYKVFLTNTDLTIEMSKNIANLYNQTGLRQISFDGLEGNRSTGLGTYGESLMPYVWYNTLSDDLKSHLIIDASRTTHFFWHIYTRMNWGEPWYAGFRESQTEYRMKNQPYFKRNFMPGMLGWFKMTPETSIEDVEWLLTRSAAHNAGFAFIAGDEAIQKNGNKNKILQLIGDWEKIRLKGLFTKNQIEIMKDIDTEYTLVTSNENKFDLHRVNSSKFTHNKKVRQPGEPLYSIFNFNHSGEEQTINFIINAIDCDISNITMEMDNYKKIKLPVSLKAGEIIKYTGGPKAYVYNINWNLISEFEITPSDLKVSSGDHSIAFDCKFNNSGKEAKAKLEVRTFAPAEKIAISK